MNQLCKVCGEPAAGYHFGAFTCEGCKSFFGRTYNNLSALGECKNNGECVINKKNRTSCKSCRLKKCLMVGMSKSGSRYGRRSNWFKIHCLIQDQQEMSNRMVEQGHLSNKSDCDDLSSKLTESSKEFLVKYKENELRQSLAAAAAAAAASAGGSGPHGAGGGGGGHSHSHGGGHHGNNSMSDLNQSHHVISPRLTSPNSSDGSNIPSPYSALFEGAKVPAFANPYLPSNQNINAGDFQKEFNTLASRFNPVTGGGMAGLPMTPISPLSPLNAAVSRLFLQNTSAILGKRFNELQKLQNEQLLNTASRFLPLHTLNTVLKPAAAAAAVASSNNHNHNHHHNNSTKDVADEVSNGMPEYYADLPEQDGPIDLSTKRLAELKELTLTAVTKCPKTVPGDHDSGFSPSSNEDNLITSPLDLTAKRQSAAATAAGLGMGIGKRLLSSSRRGIADIVVDVEHSDNDSEDRDVDVDDDDHDDGMDEVMMAEDDDEEDDDEEAESERQADDEMRGVARNMHHNDDDDGDNDDEDADISDIDVQVDDIEIDEAPKAKSLHKNSTSILHKNNKNNNSNNNNNNNNRPRDSRRQIECLP